MKAKYIIGIFIYVLLLVISEYIFLNEISQSQRMSILISTTLAALISIVLISRVVKRSEKDPK